MDTIRNYTARVDSKKRITIRGADYMYYNVKEFGNGCILLEPRELVTPASISEATLKEMDKAIDNFNKGVVSEPVDLSDFKE